MNCVNGIFQTIYSNLCCNLLYLNQQIQPFIVLAVNIISVKTLVDLVSDILF